MKTKREFLVHQVVAAIRVAHTLTGGLPYVFPNRCSSQKPMSENAIRYMLSRAGSRP